ncbi:MAG: metal-dependent hydrolase [Candidatus Hermodarchaeota archaeon]
MDIFTHFIIGILAAIYGLKSLPLSIVIYAAIMSVIADFDIFIEPLRLIKKSNFLSHKGLSHSYFTALLFSFFTAILFTFITNENFLIAWIIGFLFFSLHISLDLITASKIPIFYPFSKKRYRFFIDRAINLFLAIISGTVVLSYFLMFFYLPEVFFSNLYHYIFGFYLAYFAYRFLSKIWIQFKLPKNSLYIPGILPFVYFIYENISLKNSNLYKFSKKIQFSKKKSLILQSELFKNSDDIKFYEKALKISKDYVFFTKWEAVIPMIEKHDAYCTLLLLLTESYFLGSTYALEVVFNRNSGTIEIVSDGFNLFRR